jgi:hypothetical protein
MQTLHGSSDNQTHPCRQMIIFCFDPLSVGFAQLSSTAKAFANTAPHADNRPEPCAARTHEWGVRPVHLCVWPTRGTYASTHVVRVLRASRVRAFVYTHVHIPCVRAFVYTHIHIRCGYTHVHLFLCIYYYKKTSHDWSPTSPPEWTGRDWFMDRGPNRGSRSTPV